MVALARFWLSRYYSGEIRFGRRGEREGVGLPHFFQMDTQQVVVVGGKKKVRTFFRRLLNS